ncbi:MAG: RT0821/Lpp0805 family surface protein [Alphaproteobacteria bacterium]|nr:RT0821/Lpp0805 family surface protein [Alphaproteobacteria bacterium]
MKRLLISLGLLFPMALSAAPGWAAVRAGSPDALLSHADQRHQEQAVQNALEFNKTGQATIWENPQTGHRGRVTPTLTYRNSAGQDCRKFDRALTIDGKQALGWGTRCRTPAGVWSQPFAPRRVYAYRPYPYYQPYPYYYRPYPYYWPVSFHLFYGFGGHHHHGHRRHWHRRRH